MRGRSNDGGRSCNALASQQPSRPPRRSTRGSPLQPAEDRHAAIRTAGALPVLLTEDATALWVTSWPFAAYVKHAWAGAWVCSLFRNESETLSSELIRSAVAATRWYYGDAPTLGFITFVDASKTRRKRDPGRCYRKAGWTHVGYTIGGLHALQLIAAAMPEPAMPYGAQERLFA